MFWKSVLEEIHRDANECRDAFCEEISMLALEIALKYKKTGITSVKGI